MNWFPGTIAEAVNVSKAKNAIFVVYSEGPDELSTAFATLVNDDRIRNKLESDDFVAIKVQSDSEAYTQFAQIYKLVPFPSLFFIGKNGTPIEIVTGITKTVDELEEKIDGILGKAGQCPITTAATASANLLASERAGEGGETEVVCENGVCFKRPVQKKDETTASNATPATESAESAGASIANQSASSSAYMSATEERLRRAKELIDQKRKEKEEEAARLAKEREIQRRRLGQDLQSFKERHEESEMKKLQEERKRDKIEEQATRKRILEQIAQDKAERAQRFNPLAVVPPPKESAPVENKPPIVSDSSVARIQFKKPDGETEVKTFGSADIFGIVRSYVEENVIAASGVREFTLATSFPRKEFKVDDNPKTLLELGLVPSAVILILPLDKTTSRKLPIQSSYGLLAMLTTVFWGIINPLVSAFTYVRTRLFSRNRATGAAKRNSENEVSPNDAAKRRYLQMNPQPPKEDESSSAYKRVAGSNIHRLNETKDSDDENATWNGNSTQQQ